MDEFDELLEETPGRTPIESLDDLPKDMEGNLVSPQSLPALVTAASLLDDPDEDEGDFEPGHYKGFEILPPADWPHVKAHAHIRRRFYVRHNDTVGMVPWPGSVIVWPWDAAWERDLYRTEVESFLKEDSKKEAKRK